MLFVFDFGDFLLRISISSPPEKHLMIEGKDAPLPRAIAHQMPSFPAVEDDNIYVTTTPTREAGSEETQNENIPDVQFIPVQENDPSVRNFLEMMSQEMHGGGCCAELSEEGVNGTYFLKNGKGREVAVFKPFDEEAHSPNNPKQKQLSSGNAIENDRKGIPSGGTCIREVAAYLFDKRKNGSSLAGVPITTMIKIQSGIFQSLLSPQREIQNQSCSEDFRVGSLQKFVVHDCPSWDIGSRNFSVRQVHAIGILDIMLLNTDRHGGNILVSFENGMDSPSLIPIDHGFCFPENLQDFSSLWFEWLSWPQAKIPFSQDLKEFVLEELDIEEKIALMKDLGMENKNCHELIRKAMKLLKQAVSDDKTLYEIGLLFCRSSPEEPSLFEKM